MVYDGMIVGKFVKLRSIDVNDASFSYNIRESKKAKGLVGQPISSISAQMKYIEAQRKRPDDYYFVVLNHQDIPIGLYGIYDIKDGQGEIGREVNVGNAAQALETEVLAIEFAAEYLHLKRVVYVIYANNLKHIRMQKKLGHKPKREVMRGNIKCYEYIVTIEEAIEGQKKVKEKLSKLESKIFL